MNSLARKVAHSENALSRASVHINISAGRSPAYRRSASQLSQNASRDGARSQGSMLAGAIRSPLRSPFLPHELRYTPTYSVQSRLFHLSSRLNQEEKTKTEQPPSAETKEKKPSDSESEGKSEEPKKEGEDADKDGKEGEDGKEEGKDGKKKEDLPPPPPHGDKTPWQVFTETMNAEFQKSQEWNESTKQIQASANHFAESESVRRAREAYEKSTGAVSSTVSRSAKATAGAIGKGASWTWDTSVVKGVRKAANVTGDAVDKATQPIRNTEAYKNVKNVIDDGSSSRYGGWIEKEERRKRRELLDKQRGFKPGEVMQEDLE